MENQLSTKSLSEFQIKLLNMLLNLYDVSKTQELKSTDEIMKQHGLPAMIGTILRKVKIIEKDKTIKWKTDNKPTAEMATNVERYYQLYPKLMIMVKSFKDFFTSEEMYPFPFNEIWEQLEYHDKWEAKRSLLSVCEKGRDYTFRTDAEKSAKNGQKTGTDEIIKLSKRGLKIFLGYSQKPWACVFKEAMIDLEEIEIKIVKKIIAGYIGVKAQTKLLKTGADGMKHVRDEYRNFEVELTNTLISDQLMLPEFQIDQTRRRVENFWDEGKRIAISELMSFINYQELPENKEDVENGTFELLN